MSEQMTPEQIAQMREECTPNITVTVRQVTGGHIVSGRIVWVAPDGTPRGVQQDEAVGIGLGKLGEYVTKYHTDYAF